MSPKSRQRLLAVWILLGAALTVFVWSTMQDDDAEGVTATIEAAGTAAQSSTTELAVETTTTTAEVRTTTTPPPTTAPPTTVAPDERPAPTDPAELAAQITEAEQMVRSAEVSGSEAAAWGRRQQQLYRALSSNPEWATEVIAAVGDDVDAAVEDNWLARQNLSALVNSVTLSSTLPAWRISAPLPPGELLGYYKEAEGQTGIPWEYLAAINLIETRMGRIEGLSTAGATGPMQFLPSTWAECCEGDPTVDRDAIIGAAVYLDIRGGPEDMRRAVKGYNNSDRYVAAVEAYARVLAENEAAYVGYHSWEVYFLSSAGLIRMPVGYEEAEPIDAATWVEQHPDTLVTN